MFSFFRKNKDKAPSPPDSFPPSQMDLAERKAFRREMLYQAIRESFLSLEVISSMYKFKVVNVDARHHRFIAMIDVAKSFQIGKDSGPKSYHDIEAFIKKNAFDRFGVVLEGIYWRVSESDSLSERKTREEDSPAAAAPERLASNKQREVIGDVRNARQRLARHQYQPVSEEEKKAFMEAVRKGATPPAIQVGEQAYKSDLAPLDGGSRISGTQYGKLE